MRAATVLWRLHRWAYRISAGRVGGRLLGVPVLLLTTTGRRTGRLHTTALTHLVEGRNVVVIASNGGAPNHPAWLLNLRARPEAEIQVGGQRRRVRAREANGAERERFWTRVVQAMPRYADYKARTSRRIPVVVLEPIDRLPGETPDHRAHPSGIMKSKE